MRGDLRRQSGDLALGGAVVTGLALALSSTAFGVQVMRERGEFGAPYGRRLTEGASIARGGCPAELARAARAGDPAG